MRSPARIITQFVSFIAAVAAFTAPAKPRPALPPYPEAALHVWRFDDDRWWRGPLYAPQALRNIEVAESWSGYALKMDGGQPRLLQFPMDAAPGKPNFSPGEGTVRFWFQPHWSSASLGGQGPGTYARLFEVGAWTPDASYGWSALYFNPEGTAIYFSTQADGQGTDHLKAEIQWEAGRWHQLAFVYAAKFSALYVDGELVAAGEGVPLWPKAQVFAQHGFSLGSDSAGGNLAQGQFEELTTFAQPSGPWEIAANHQWARPLADLGPITPEEEAQMRAWYRAQREARTQGMRTQSAEGNVVVAESYAAQSAMGSGSSYASGSLWLEVVAVDEFFAHLVLHGTIPGAVYEILSSQDPTAPLSVWWRDRQVLGAYGQDYTAFQGDPDARPHAFFLARAIAPGIRLTLPPGTVGGSAAGDGGSGATPAAANVVTTDPLLQLVGYSEAPLQSIWYQLTTADGRVTSGRGAIIKRDYDTALRRETTNWFQLFDLQLQPGNNLSRSPWSPPTARSTSSSSPTHLT
jgi:hypothetical protein